MSQRVIVGLQPNVDAAQVKAAVLAAGAESVRDPSPVEPVLVVTVPDGRELEPFLRAVKKVPGVRYAEPDAWQFTA